MSKYLVLIKHIERQLKAKRKFLKRTKDRGPSLAIRKKANLNRQKVEFEQWREKNLVRMEVKE